ncbi:hypothetical protein PsorP6_010499 [Peronosclerospora sorghi]|uniref:Uncharacterized protein n=1 Tax=Peronosclerospora sorghi TaxID=230839 RepID=A0ACC0VUL1_9STRA|nr:hypothetical protein PsorP6_010499 [Peronosclerospora sorghi]
METAFINQSPGLMQLHHAVLLAITAAHFIDDASAWYLKSPPSGIDQDAEATDREDRMPKGPGFFNKMLRRKTVASTAEEMKPLLADSRQENEFHDTLDRLEQETKVSQQEIDEATAAQFEKVKQLFLESGVPPGEILTNKALMAQFIRWRNSFPDAEIPDLTWFLRRIYSDDELRAIIDSVKNSESGLRRDIADDLEKMLQPPPHQGETSG